MLVVFPIAFFTGCFITDIFDFLSDLPALAPTAYYLNIAAIGSALLAAIPGIIDYIYTVPPGSSAKKRATSHALLNVSTIVLFALAFYFRSNETNNIIIISLEALGMVCLAMAGWMGGTLVYRNQIGVDPRYADAGKWNEAYIKASVFPIKVADAAEISLNQMKLIHVQGKRIVIAKTESGYVAFDDYCTHKGGSLAGGSMICGTVQCPWHGTQFDVNTGAVKAGPAKEPIPTYAIEEKNGSVYLLDLKERK